MTDRPSGADERQRRLAALGPAQRALLVTRLRRQRGTERQAIPRRPLDGPLPLSFSQQRMWFLERLAPGSGAFHVAAAYRLGGPLDIAALDRARRRVVRRHAALRSRFPMAAGRPVARVDRGAPPLPVVDLAALPAAAGAAAAGRLRQAAAFRPFDLARGPLWRLVLLRLGAGRGEADEHHLLLAAHHIVCDGGSLAIFFGELERLYAVCRDGRPEPLADRPLPYPDYAAWQRRRLAGEHLERLLAYWRRRLDGAPGELALPADRPRPPVASLAGGLVPLHLPAPLAAALEALARRSGATLFLVLLAAFSALLARLGGQRQVLVGVPVDGRDRRELEGAVGLYVNTLVHRADTAGDPSFAEHLARLQDGVLADREHQELPFERLVEELRPQRDPGRPPLVQAVLAFEQRRAGRPSLAGLDCQILPLAQARAPFDLTLSLVDGERGVGGWWLYAAELFDATAVRRLAASFDRLLAAVAADPGRPLSALPLLSPAAAHLLTHELCDTACLPPPPHFAARVAAVAAERPQVIAVAGSDERVSYDELLSRARRLGGRLQGLGAGPGVRVALAVGRSPALVEGLLGILAAGAAFVPLDPDSPAERLGRLLADALAGGGPRLLLAGAAGEERTVREPPGVRRIVLAAGRGGAGGPEDGEPAPRRRAAAPLAEPLFEEQAYVIYTSGTTGEPKGVVIPHRGLANFTREVGRTLAAGPGDRVLQFAALGFDALVLEVALALGGGATLLLAPAATLLPGPPLAALLAARAVTHALLPPSALAILDAVAPEGGFPLLATLAAGGEECPPELAARWRRGRRFFNAYGPTEVTVVTTWWLLRAEAPPGRRLPIGRPLGGLAVAVTDRHLRRLPIGVPGELCAGGAGLARGYLHRPALTAGRFVPDPCAGRPGERLYRTGDRVRLRPGGELEFLGRVDHQLKVRGFRIEPEEVETLLAALPGVHQAALAAAGAAGSPERRLVAFLAVGGDAAGGRGATASETAEVRARLARSLPGHLLPSVVRFVPALPQTAAGKLDRRTLARLAGEAGEAPGSTAAAPAVPRDEIEAFIAGVWRRVLELPAVGVHDSFFDLGGQSLLLARVHAALARRFPALALVDLFRYPTVASLAADLATRERGAGEEMGAAAPQAGAASPAAGGAVATPGEAVAIVAMSGRFPGADDLDAFWRNLAAGVESITFFSPAELAAAGSDPAVFRRPDYVPAAGVLAGVECFDPEHFGLSPREAELMDPQHRLLLECAWESFEQAGYDPAAHAGEVGVFVGTSAPTYLAAAGVAAPEADPLQVVVGNDGAFAASRLSYKLGLRGPSLAVQTACSTSLVAVHLACRSLLAGECDLALAGGVGLSLPQQRGYLYQEGGVNSPDGHCRAFDAEARGTVGGSGVGLVLLRRLSDARAEGDPVRALIRGSAVNNDGALRLGYTAPAVEGQATVLARALTGAGVAPETVGYVEAHGSGTPLGDPVEMTAIARVYGGERRPPASCAVGSVKSNIGHLDAAAGIAGLIKAVLALEHGAVPASLHFRRPNPELDLDGGRFFVPARTCPWPLDGRPRRAAVSSFGLGGTNAHAVLEEAPPPAPRDGASTEQPAADGERPELIPLSARSAAALATAGRRLAAHLRRNDAPALADVAYTLQVGRRGFDHRRVVICRRRRELIAALEAEEPPRGTAAWIEASRLGSGGRPVAFLLPGVGEHYPGMAAGLWCDGGPFRRHFERYAELLAPCLGVDPRRLLFGQAALREGVGAGAGAGVDLRALVGRAAAGAGPAGDGVLERTAVVQPLLVALELALARQWIDWGVRPQALLGYSVGEYAAACLAGVLDEEDALALVAERARLIEELPAGAMLALPLAEHETVPLLSGSLALAALNGPALTIVAGALDEVAALERQLAGRGVVCRRLPAGHAFHTPAMAPVAVALRRQLATCRLREPRLPYLSNVTGGWITPAEATDPEYWLRHLVRPVRFADGLDRLLAAGEEGLEGAALAEVGPGQSLCVLARQHPAGAGRTVVATLRHRHQPAGDREHLLGALGRLWLAGVTIDWRRAAGGRGRRVALPTYPFERRRCWLEPARRPVAPAPAAPSPIPDVAAPAVQPAIRDWFYVPLWHEAVPPAPAGWAGEAGGGPWLLFADAGGLGAALATRLAARGVETIVVVRAGSGAAEPEPKGPTLRPDRRDDYLRLLAPLAARGRPPAAVLHLWSVDPAGDGLDPAARAATALERGFTSLLLLAQAWGELLPGAPLRLTAVCRGLWGVAGGERLRPEVATLLGPSLVIPQEYPAAACRTVDVAGGGAAGWPPPLVEALLAEAAAGDGETVIALRDRRRWLRRFSPLPLAAGDGDHPRLRRGGVYLITGGLGGIGLTLAEHLARSADGKVALLGRTPLPPPEQWQEAAPAGRDATATAFAGEAETGDDGRAGDQHSGRRLAELRRLQAAGARLLPLTADVTDSAAVRRAVAEVRRRLGPIDGVIHAAGLPGGGLIQLKDPAAAARVIAPKLTGTLAVAEALAEDKPDFFVLCSSLTGILGSVGQADYCAANAFLGAFAQQQAAGGRPVTAIDWDGWQGRGMALEAAEGFPLLGDDSPVQKIAPAEGIEVFDRVLRSRLPQVAVSIEPLAALAARARGRRPRRQSGEGSVHPRPALGPSYAAPRDALEAALAALWQELLGIETVGVDDRFVELGGHSLTALRLLARLREEQGVALPLKAVYEHPTIAELAPLIERQRREGAPGEAAAWADTPLVALESGGTRPPLVWVHPAGGGVLSYRDLARRLGPEQPFWALVARGLERDEPPFDELPAMAAWYLRAVRARWPAGPYLLAGWSVGGLVAYEMACQLAGAGRRVALLALLDSRLPQAGVSLEDEEDAALLSELFHLPYRPDSDPSPAARGAAVIRRARRAGRLPADFDHAAARRLLRVYRAMARAVDGYRPRPYPGRLTLLRPAGASGEDGSDPTLGWAALAQGGVELRRVGGEHWNMVFEPHAEELARALDDCLTAALGGGEGIPTESLPSAAAPAAAQS